MNSIYFYFFLITYHVCGGDSFLIPHAVFLYINCYSAGKRNEHNKPVFYLNKDTSDGLFIPIS